MVHRMLLSWYSFKRPTVIATICSDKLWWFFSLFFLVSHHAVLSNKKSHSISNCVLCNIFYKIGGIIAHNECNKKYYEMKIQQQQWNETMKWMFCLYFYSYSFVFLIHKVSFSIKSCDSLLSDLVVMIIKLNCA